MPYWLARQKNDKNEPNNHIAFGGQQTEAVLRFIDNYTIQRINPRAVLGFSFAGYVPLASQSPCPLIVYFVASYRAHLSHFWENVIFAIPTKALSFIYASTSFWTGGFVLLCNWLILKLWFQERNVMRGDCYI